MNDDPAARFSANGFSYESEFTDAQCMVNHYYNLFQREWRPDFDMTKHKCKLYYVESKIGDDTKRYLSEPIMHNYFDMKNLFHLFLLFFQLNLHLNYNQKLLNKK